MIDFFQDKEELVAKHLMQEVSRRARRQEQLAEARRKQRAKEVYQHILTIVVEDHEEEVVSDVEVLIADHLFPLPATNVIDECNLGIMDNGEVSLIISSRLCGLFESNYDLFETVLIRDLCRHLLNYGPEFDRVAEMVTCLGITEQHHKLLTNQQFHQTLYRKMAQYFIKGGVVMHEFETDCLLTEFLGINRTLSFIAAKLIDESNIGVIFDLTNRINKLNERFGLKVGIQEMLDSRYMSHRYRIRIEEVEES